MKESSYSKFAFLVAAAVVGAIAAELAKQELKKRGYLNGGAN